MQEHPHPTIEVKYIFDQTKAFGIPESLLNAFPHVYAWCSVLDPVTSSKLYPHYYRIPSEEGLSHPRNFVKGRWLHNIPIYLFEIVDELYQVPVKKTVDESYNDLLVALDRYYQAHCITQRNIKLLLSSATTSRESAEILQELEDARTSLYKLRRF